eukprot:COSAG01_NODE_13290_length_1606_cov_2.605176_2_plen_209_part_00
MHLRVMIWQALRERAEADSAQQDAAKELARVAEAAAASAAAAEVEQAEEAPTDRAGYMEWLFRVRYDPERCGSVDAADLPSLLYDLGVLPHQPAVEPLVLALQVSQIDNQTNKPAVWLRCRARHFPAPVCRWLRQPRRSNHTHRRCCVSLQAREGGHRSRVSEEELEAVEQLRRACGECERRHERAMRDVAVVREKRLFTHGAPCSCH